MTVAAVLAYAVAGLFGAGCNGGESADPKPGASPSGVASPTSASPGTTLASPATPGATLPGYSRDKRTGVAAVDTVVDALLSGQADRIRPLLQFYAVPCRAPATGIPAPPACPPGAADGTKVDVFPNASCPEGRYVTRDGIDAFLREIATASSLPFAVYRQEPAPPAGSEFPRGDYAIVLTTPRPPTNASFPPYSVSTVQVEGGRIFSGAIACPHETAATVLGNRVASAFLLPPP
ncbi:MAG: hypothetical protein HY875_16750 [Chloroflexi bacterium]|nr:hypothetical protein [Chloroflexota bacterium]